MASNLSIQSLHLLNLQVSKSPQTPSISIFDFNFIPLCSTTFPRFGVSIRPSLSIYKQSSSYSPVCDNSSIEHSFAASYLMNRFGWAPEVANSKAKYLRFKTPENPDRVLAFFKKYGFTETQISKLVWICPQYLSSDLENSILPKLAFLRSLGLSRTEITSLVTKVGILLSSSLENRIVPRFNRILDLVKSNDEAVKLVKRYPRTLFDNVDGDRIQILREVGVPDHNIVASMICRPRGVWPASDILRKTVEEVKEMGFDPGCKTFIVAIRTVGSMRNSDWEDKVQVFKKYGWSDREILLAFRKSPTMITRSIDQIEGVIDFLVNRMGVEATTIASYSNIINFSLKKRIVPRCLVYQTLLEKGLCKRRLSILTLCTYSENKFVSKVIKPYENAAPELWDLYKELLDLGNDL